MSITTQIQSLKSILPSHVTLVAVSKTKSVGDIQQAYDAGQRIFGENKIQEMTEKFEQLPKDIQWHMIGHVQTNKVKYMAPYVSLIQGVDSLKLLEEVNKQARKNNRIINCLLQMHIATEDTKFGLNEAELKQMLDSEAFSKLAHVKVKGLMGMASFTDDQRQIKNEFDYLKSVYDKCKSREADFSILSMGMSSDYEQAISSGSTMVRIGSSIFGGR